MMLICKQRRVRTGSRLLFYGKCLSWVLFQLYGGTFSGKQNETCPAVQLSVSGISNL